MVPRTPDNTRPAQRKSRYFGGRRRISSGAPLRPTRALPTICASLGMGSTGQPSDLTTSHAGLLSTLCDVLIGHAATAACLSPACLDSCLDPFPGPIGAKVAV